MWLVFVRMKKCLFVSTLLLTRSSMKFVLG